MQVSNSRILDEDSAQWAVERKGRAHHRCLLLPGRWYSGYVQLRSIIRNFQVIDNRGLDPRLDGSSYPYSSFKFHIKPALLFPQSIACVFHRCLYWLLRSSTVNERQQRKVGQSNVSYQRRAFHRSPFQSLIVIRRLRCRHTCPPSSATGASSHVLILSLLLVPLFRGVYIPTQLIYFSVLLPHLQCFTVNVVSRFWSKRLRSFTMFHYSTNPLSDTHLGTSGTLSADSKITKSRGPCSFPLGKGKDRSIRARKGGGGEP